MTVYIVTQDRLYKGKMGIHEVFSKREDAETYVAACNKRFGDNRVIFERKVKSAIRESKRCLSVQP